MAALGRGSSISRQQNRLRPGWLPPKGAIPKAFYQAAAQIYKPVAMEGEGGLGSLSTLNWQTLGWCEGCVADEPNSLDGLDIPDVDRVK